MRNGKYNAKRTNGYASKREADVAAKLHALEQAGNIRCLREQVPYTLVEGKDGIRAIKWIADFTYIENDTNRFVVLDVKGYRNAIYLLKKKLAALLLGLKIEEA